MRAIAFTVAIMASMPASAEIMSAEAAFEAVGRGDIVLVDIRTPGEWAEDGIPEGALPIDMRDPKFLAKLERLQALNGDTPIALICATGGRTHYVVSALKAHGYSGFFDVSEGMHGSAAGPGWLKRSYSVTSHEAAEVQEKLAPLD